SLCVYLLRTSGASMKRHLAALTILLPTAALFAQADPPALTPELQNELKKLRAALIHPVPKDAAWRHFTFSDPSIIVSNSAGSGPQVTQFGGFLLDETPDTLHIIDWFGLERTLAKANTTIADQTLLDATKSPPIAVTPAGGGGRGRGAGPGIS